MVDKNGLKSFIELNSDINIKYVIFTHNKEDFEVLRDILIELDFMPVPSINNELLKDMMNSCAEEANYNCGWRISKYMGVAWNTEPIEWWKQIYSDILEITEDGTIRYIGDLMNSSLAGMIPLVRNGNVIGCYFCNFNDLQEDKNGNCSYRR